MNTVSANLFIARFGRGEMQLLRGYEYVKHECDKFFGSSPAMGTEPVTAGVSWQNTIDDSEWVLTRSTPVSPKAHL